jgi:hypothetical protein
MSAKNVLSRIMSLPLDGSIQRGQFFVAVFQRRVKAELA